MAISAIRAAEKCDQNETEMRPGCNPLTLDQLREMVDKPVYLYIYNTATDSGWHIIKAVTEDKIIFRGRNTMYVPISSIGKSFDLYAYPPAHIDREAWSKYCPKCKYEDDNEGIPIYYSSDCTRHVSLVCQSTEPCYKLLAAFLEAKPVDVAPVVRGQWLKEVYIDPYGADWTKYVCSLCGRVEIKKEPYCSCGAKTDGGEKANE